mmetsp:Transcript_108700/g.346955  ORF Transcript_108700/g.346955 Transcript_108700/m.346955 type:complete len:681 (-) Transcript_108700:112-2154(-)
MARGWLIDTGLDLVRNTAPHSSAAGDFHEAPAFFLGHPAERARLLRTTTLASSVAGVALPSSIPLGKATPSSPSSPPLRGLEFESADPSHLTAGSCLSEPRQHLRLATWNVLAPNYALAKSFPDVDAVWLASKTRKPGLRWVLEALQADVLCLQEVQHPDEWQNLLDELGFEASFAARPSRHDGCAIAWRKGRFRTVDKFVFNFDGAIPESAPQSVQSRFSRCNIGLVVELELASEHRVSLGNSSCSRIVLATTHLYWGKEHEDVRAWQLQLLMEAIRGRLASSPSSHPDRLLAICGDLNLLPGSASHGLLRRGKADFPRALRRVERFLFDSDIAKAAKPLRLLGLDVTIETERQRAERGDGRGTCEGAPPIFARAVAEGRFIVSASRRLLGRSDCPPGAYYLDTRRCEESLAEMCSALSVEIDRDRLFSRCVKCNGHVSEMENTPETLERAMILAASTGQGNPRWYWKAQAGLPLYVCEVCCQVYWFSASKGSASAQAHQQVQSLLRRIDDFSIHSRGGPRDPDAPSGGRCTDAGRRSVDLDAGRCSVDVEVAVEAARDDDPSGDGGAAAFLRDGGGSLELGVELHSAYADLESPGSCEHVTNSKLGFHGLIDYIWLSPTLHAGLRARLRLPRVEELRRRQGAKASNGGEAESGPLPSLVGAEWPSDHWPLAVDLELPG